MNRPAAPGQAGDRRPMLEAFPRAGRRVEHAYHELGLAESGTPDERRALGDPRLLARPWDPASCVDPRLRSELWRWLDDVVRWFNREYVWDPAGLIPACWPRHPHLVHEVALLADLRRRAGLALAGDALEEWHRYAVPAFVERMRTRMQSHCAEKGHEPWPAQGRHTRHLADDAAQDRISAFDADVRALADPLQATRPPDGPPAAGPSGPSRPRLQLIDGMRVDTGTGEILD